MKYVLTDIKSVINELMNENNITINKLATALEMNEIKLQQKLTATDDQNKFTVLQLEEIAHYFGYSLNIDFKKGNDVRHCKTVDEVIRKGKENMSFLFFNNDNK